MHVHLLSHFVARQISASLNLWGEVSSADRRSIFRASGADEVWVESSGTLPESLAVPNLIEVA